MKANRLFNIFVIASVLIHTATIATSEHHQMGEHTHEEVEFEGGETGHASGKKSDDPDCLWRRCAGRAFASP